MIKSANTQVFVLGGYDGDVIFGDLWRLDLDLLQWNRIPAQALENIVFASLVLPRKWCSAFLNCI
jgi:hypothetical protein